MAAPGETAPVSDTAAADAAADSIDLAALGLDPASAEAGFDDNLNLYGFADFQFNADYSNGAWNKRFASGKLNIYLAKSLTKKFRTLAEVRLMYLPNGGRGDMGGDATVSVANDPVSGHEVAVGGISIQRVYAEYDVHRYVTVRAGHWLTPYGIWNVDHGSPAIIPVSAPYIIGESLIPESQTGLQAFQTVSVGDYRIGYYATVSNGRSWVESTQDPDNRVALGGRLEFEAPLFGTLKLGVSGYGGRTTVMSTDGSAPSWAYDERDVAVDAQWEHGAVYLQGEYIRHKRNPIAGSEPPMAEPVLGAPMGPMSIGDTNKGSATGAYVLAAYRTTHLWNVTPFAYYEYYAPVNASFEVNGFHGGLNFRPIPQLVLKAQAITAKIGDTSIGDMWMFQTQAAWVF